MNAPEINELYDNQNHQKFNFFMNLYTKHRVIS